MWFYCSISGIPLVHLECYILSGTIYIAQSVMHDKAIDCYVILSTHEQYLPLNTKDMTFLLFNASPRPYAAT